MHVRVPGHAGHYESRLERGGPNVSQAWTSVEVTKNTVTCVISNK